MYSEYTLNGEYSQQRRNVISITTHGLFSGDPRQGYDIALLNLEQPLQWNSDVSPICLPNVPSDSLEGQECVIAGWGSTQGNYLKSSTIL